MVLSVKTKLGILCLLIAYLLLIPGITLPVLHITTTLDKAVLAEMGKASLMENQDIPPFMLQMAKGLLDGVHISGTELVQDTEKSILGTAETFWQSSHFVVAVLIVLFSVVIPVIKGMLMAVAGMLKLSEDRERFKRIAALLSKWSMTDVFVMALIIVFLGSNTSTSALISTQAEFESGFYFFMGYCLFSIASSQLLLSSKES